MVVRRPTGNVESYGDSPARFCLHTLMVRPHSRSSVPTSPSFFTTATCVLVTWCDAFTQPLTEPLVSLEHTFGNEPGGGLRGGRCAGDGLLGQPAEDAAVDAAVHAAQAEQGLPDRRVPCAVRIQSALPLQ